MPSRLPTPAQRIGLHGYLAFDTISATHSCLSLPLLPLMTSPSPSVAFPFFSTSSQPLPRLPRHSSHRPHHLLPYLSRSWHPLSNGPVVTWVVHCMPSRACRSLKIPPWLPRISRCLSAEDCVWVCGRVCWNPACWSSISHANIQGQCLLCGLSLLRRIRQALPDSCFRRSTRTRPLSFVCPPSCLPLRSSSNHNFNVLLLPCTWGMKRASRYPHGPSACRPPDYP